MACPVRLTVVEGAAFDRLSQRAGRVLPWLCGRVSLRVWCGVHGGYGIASRLLAPCRPVGWKVAGDTQSTQEDILACWQVLIRPVAPPRTRRR